jgi:hypothetical protein
VCRFEIRSQIDWQSYLGTAFEFEMNSASATATVSRFGWQTVFVKPSGSG